jgi:hypothetical protein
MLNNQSKPSTIHENSNSFIKNSEETEKLILASPSSNDNKFTEKEKTKKLFSWENIKESTNDFLNSQSKIFQNLTTTLDNIEINNLVLKGNLEIKSMFEREDSFDSPLKKCYQSMNEGNENEVIPKRDHQPKGSKICTYSLFSY